MKTLFLLLFLAVSGVGQTPPCENAEAKAFDWQIGIWQSEDGKQVHEIKKLLDGCIIQETWKTEGIETAVALKSFDDGRHNKTGEKKWFYSWAAKPFHQLWEGRKEVGQWRFYRNWFSNGEAVLSRTYWTQISADKLERIVEQSRDKGKTWKPWVKDAFNRVTQVAVNVEIEKERKFFDFLIGEWRMEKLVAQGETGIGGDDVFKFRKTLDGNGIFSEWYFNRGTTSKPNFIKGEYYSAFDNNSKTWSFYYISPFVSQFYQGVKENGNWWFYKDYDLNGDKFTQRQAWEKIDENTISRIIENSRDGGKTWQRSYAATLKRVSGKTLQTPVLADTDRIRIAEAFRLREKFVEKIWKDWSNAPFGILLVTPENEFLINHQSPAKDFSEIGNNNLLNSQVFWRKRIFNPSFLATFPAVNGISTIVVGQAENTFVKTSTPWAVTVLHEHFHQFQTSQPKYYDEVNALDLANGDTSGMWMLNYAFPYSDEAVKTKFEALCKLLAELLENSEKTISKEKLNQYLTARKDFQNSLKPNDYKYFSFQVWQEGVARYTEYQIAKLASEEYEPSKEFSQLKDFTSYKNVADNLWKNILQDLKTLKLDKYQRTAFYPFGAGEALLLDRVNPNWKTRYNSERFYLEKYFDSPQKLLSVRNAHSLAFDENLNKTILFGGADSEKVLNDTWTFDGERWSLISTNNSPSPRTFPAMTYDSVRKKILLFGGNRVLFGKDDNDYEFFNDFWEFDGKTWSKINVPTPDGRAEASFSFDRQRQKAVLFGGYRIENGAMKPLSDTWEWDGKAWKKMAEGVPTARSGAAIAYDANSKKVVLFGGGIRTGGANETWEWDGKIWREIKSAKTEPRYNSTMVFDESRGKIIRFGGWDGKQRVSETWEFDGKTWTKLNIESPDARNHAQMVYDMKRKKIVLFGGHNGDFVFGDTWEFDGGSWKKIISVDPQKRIENGH